MLLGLVIAGIFIVLFVIWMAMRIHVTHQSERFEDELPLLSLPGITDKSEDTSSINGKGAYVNLKGILNNRFANHYIRASEKDEFAEFYKGIYHDAVALIRKMEKFRIEPSEGMANFIDEYESIS